MEGVSAFPLDWPPGWPRTPTNKRKRARYHVEFKKACDELSRELERMAARNIVLSSNVPLRRDGKPYATAAKSGITDPGVAVYFSWRGRPYVVACDQWQHVKDNFRAVGLTIAAMRLIARAGASHLLERAFTGFKALPPSPSELEKKPWWVILRVQQTATKSEIEKAYKELITIHHPDAGGTVEMSQVLNRAYSDAMKGR